MAHVFLLKAHPLPFSPCSHNSYWLVTYKDNNIHWTKTRIWSIIKLHYTLTSKDIPFPFLESRVPSGLRSSTISPTKNQMTLKKNQRSISSQWNKTKQVISSMDCVSYLFQGALWKLTGDHLFIETENKLNNINMDTNNYFSFFLDACTDTRVISIKRLVYGPWTTYYYYNNYHNMLFREKIYSIFLNIICQIHVYILKGLAKMHYTQSF